jgi:hypothetical protein
VTREPTCSRANSGYGTRRRQPPASHAAVDGLERKADAATSSGDGESASEDEAAHRSEHERMTELYFGHTTPDETVVRHCHLLVRDSATRGAGGVWISIRGDIPDPTTGVSVWFSKEAAEDLLHELVAAIAESNAGREYSAFLPDDCWCAS